MKVTIEIPDNCELVKYGEKYIVKEKKTGPSVPPKTWEEFCERTPIKKGEYFINTESDMIRVDMSVGCSRNCDTDKNILTCKEEAEAFLALMQLRQLRKAWVGDWDYSTATTYAIIKAQDKKPAVHHGHWVLNYALSFPTKEMADDFLNCFRDLCETAKMLL